MINCTALSGNTVMLRKMTYEDSASFNALRGVIEGGGASAPLVVGLALATQRISNIHECEGNVGLHPLLVASAPAVIAACDFADALP